MSSSDTSASSNSLSGIVSTLVPIAIISGVYLVIFLVLRRSQRRFYAPRTYLGSLRDSERTPPLPNGLFNWFGQFWKIPDTHALQHQSLDAYLFLRFLRICIALCFVGCLITWPILFPVNATGGGNQQQLDMLSYSNIDKETQKYRYFAHCLVSMVFYGFVMYLILRECIFYINLRQAFLLSPLYSKRISSRTVLFTSVPDAYQDEVKLRMVFGETIKSIWIAGNTEKLEELIEERDKTALQLEKAEVKLITLANENHQKAVKKGTAPAAPDDDQAINSAEAEPGSIAARWVPAKDRPTHRTGLLGLLGKKVDTIVWCRTELERLIPEAEAAQAQYRAGEYNRISSAFIEFRTQAEAEGAAQILAHHNALHMAPRYIGIRPDEIVWASLSMPWWQRVVRRYLVLAFISAMIIFWAIPVAFVGAISNINYLETISWLEWLKDIPSVIMGVVTGLLPSVALSILMSLVPVIMRFSAKLAGEPSISRIELFTQNAYFAFQTVDVFLVTTLSSGAAAVAKQVAKDPSSVTGLLASNLPKASNFYMSYIIVQGLSIAVSVMTQVVGFAVFTLLYKFLAKTPRAMYTKWANLSAISWGNTLPVYCMIVVIAISYAGIAPLVLGFATIGMSLFYLAWRYNVFFVTDTQVDTRGLIYPRALKQLFAGIYLGEVCLIGLFAVSVSPGPLICMIAFLVFTVLFHLSLNSALNPLLYNLPMSLLAEEESLQLLDHVEGGPADPVDPVDGNNSAQSKNASATVAGTHSGNTASSVPGKKPNFLAKFLKPWIYSDYLKLRELVPAGVYLDPYPEGIVRDAYLPPAVTKQPPLLWIPADPLGVSKQEIAHTSKVIGITDEGCSLDALGKLVWDRESTRPPVWEEKILY